MTFSTLSTSFFEQNLEHMLLELMKIPSVTGNEKEICDYIEEILKIVSGGKIYRYKNNLVFVLGEDKLSTIALVGHLDTVPLSNGQKSPCVEDGKVWGRGACDMKAGLACMLKACGDIVNGKISPNNNLILIFYAGEEGLKEEDDLPEILNKYDFLKKIDFAYVLEPTEGVYSVGCMGSATCEIKIRGVPAHSAWAWLGDSAIDKSVSVIEAVKNFKEKEHPFGDGIVGIETMNVTQIKTENAHNVVPELCKLVINYRYEPGVSLGEAVSRIRKVTNCEPEVLIGSFSCLADTSKFDQFLKKDISKEMFQGWTDIETLNTFGVPAVNYGPGSMSVAHKIDEHVQIDELRSYYGRLIEHL